MRILITGGTGFIGRPTVKKLLDNDHKLFLLVRTENHGYPRTKNISISKGNLTDMEHWWKEVMEFRPDTALHMAWEGIPNYDYKTSLKNLEYGLELVRRLAEFGCGRIVCTGSCWEYGKQKGLMKEHDTAQPVNSFTAAKVSLHNIGRAIARENNTRWTWLRLFYVYGPGQRESSLIPHIIRCLKNDTEPEIKNPDNRNDFVYVEDVAEAITAVITNPNTEDVYNIGEGKSTSVRYILKRIYKEFGREYKEDDVRIKNPDVDFWADIVKIKADTGWEPKTRIETGIRQTVCSSN